MGKSNGKKDSRSIVIKPLEATLFSIGDAPSMVSKFTVCNQSVTHNVHYTLKEFVAEIFQLHILFKGLINHV